MSTGAECIFYEKEPRAWYYDLQQWPYGEWPEFDTFGPFPTWRQAYKHLDDNHANPGGYSIHPLPGCPHDLLKKREVVFHNERWDCDRCGSSLTDEQVEETRNARV
jgi:hypothetical protein